MTSGSDDESSDPNDDVCAICDDGGNLMVCDKCPYSYHRLCLGLQHEHSDSDEDDAHHDRDDDDDDEWTCTSVGRKCTRRKNKRTLTDASADHVCGSWVGRCLRTVARNKYYSGVNLPGGRVSVGDIVAVNGEAEDGGDLVSTVDALWEDPYGAKWFSGCWMYRPDSTIYGRMEHHGKREIFESTHFDENEVESIIEVVHVFDTEEKCEAFVTQHPEKEVYFSRIRYDYVTGEYRPILKGEEVEHETTLSGRLARKKMILDEDAAEFAKLTTYGKAVAKLQLSAIPTELPCRQDEKAEIERFLVNGVKRGGVAGGLYISGMPGTGKTATVHQIIAEMHAKQNDGALPPFQFVELNGMKLPDPQYAYSLFWKALTGSHASPAKASMLLERRFSTASSKRTCCILLIDELDYIMTKKQNVIYNFFEWPSRRHARLVVMGIANTMDLPEQLMPRVSSRLGLQRVTFAPYNRVQLQAIVEHRLGDLKVFDRDAIELCARKVASVSGDIRRALHICRRAVELGKGVENNNSTKNNFAVSTRDRKKRKTGASLITMAHIDAAIRDLFNSNDIEAVSGCADHEKILLACVLLESKHRRSDELDFGRLADRHKRLCRSHQILPLLTTFQVLMVARRLSELQLLTMEQSRSQSLPSIRLNIQTDDVAYALRDDDMWNKVFSSTIL